MKSQRHEHLLALLDSNQRMNVADLARELDVSEITARRDLLELEAGGFLRRVHGGATRSTSRSFERPYFLREQQQHAAKDAIACEAAMLVESGDAIALDVGSTVLRMVEYLSMPTDLTIVTANLRTGWAVANSKVIPRPRRLIVAGGVVRDDEMSMIGESSLAQFRRLRVDTAFLGVAGISARAGITDYNLDDADLKRVLVDSARKVVVLADSTKLGEEYFAHVADVPAVDVLITDSGAPPELLGELRDGGLDVRVVTI